ncbi:group-specific protein [Paenibacillus humicus]|uniref:group-specific protein n=1 Tax=Paenibacillus humicus TaxID=412861 RepID=UPI003D2725D2
MLSIQVDEAEIKEMCRERITSLIKEVEGEFVFWDRKELERKTCMSWPFILKSFFYDTRFKKFKVGNKWFFPAKETKEFLVTWLHEQETD